MYTIIFENKYGKQFVSDFIFNNLELAKKELTNLGYKENNRIFYLELDWTIMKAYIHNFKVNNNE
jgi:hypothetical protein